MRHLAWSMALSRWGGSLCWRWSAPSTHHLQMVVANYSQILGPWPGNSSCRKSRICENRNVVQSPSPQWCSMAVYGSSIWRSHVLPNPGGGPWNWSYSSVHAQTSRTNHQNSLTWDKGSVFSQETFLCSLVFRWPRLEERWGEPMEEEQDNLETKRQKVDDNMVTPLDGSGEEKQFGFQPRGKPPQTTRKDPWSENTWI